MTDRDLWMTEHDVSSIEVRREESAALYVAHGRDDRHAAIRVDDIEAELFDGDITAWTFERLAAALRAAR